MPARNEPRTLIYAPPEPAPPPLELKGKIGPRVPSGRRGARLEYPLGLRSSMRRRRRKLSRRIRWPIRDRTSDPSTLPASKDRFDRTGRSIPHMVTTVSFDVRWIPAVIATPDMSNPRSTSGSSGVLGPLQGTTDDRSRSPLACQRPRRKRNQIHSENTATTRPTMAIQDGPHSTTRSST